MAVMPPVLAFASISANNKISLGWSNGETYRYIDVQRKPTGGAYATIATMPGSYTGFIDSSVEDGKQYAYEVRGRTLTETSAWSNEKSATTPLAAADGLSGYSSAAGTIANLSWNDKSQNESEYRIYMDGAYSKAVGSNVTATTVTGLAPGSTHVWTVRPYNAAAGLGPVSNSFSLTMLDPPAKPSDLVATAVSATEIVVNFKDNSDNELDFRLEHSTDGVTFAALATLGAGVTTYLHSGLTSLTRHWYRVRARNTSGYSAYSNTADTWTFAAISPPSNLALLAAKVNGVYGVEATIDDNSSLEDAHCLERGEYDTEKTTDGGLENWASSTNLTSWTESLSGTSTVNREAVVVHSGTYACRIDVDSANSGCYIHQTETLVASAPYKLTFAYRTDPGKTASFRFCNSTAAVSLALDGSWAASAIHTLPSSNGAYRVVTFYFDAHPSYTSYLFLIGAYSAGAYSAASTSIYLDSLSVMEATMAEIAQLEPNRTYYHDTGVSAGSLYAYRARAKQGAATYSGYSSSAAITVPDKPAVPSDFAIDEYQDTWARLSWTPVEGEDGYIIQQSEDNGGSWVEVARVLITGVNHIEIAGLAPGTNYRWSLQSYNGYGISSPVNFSPQVSTSMRATYLPSAFERLLRRTAPEIIYPCEVEALLPIGGMTLVTGQIYTYEVDFDEGGVPIDDVQENGVSLTAQTSIDTVEALAGSWWHDLAIGKLYVHVSDGGDPINFYIGALFRLRFTTGHATWYGTDRYLPFLPIDGIPDVTQDLPPYWDGPYSMSTGSIGFLNPRIYGQWFWDSKAARYKFANRRVVVYAGGPDFTYAQLEPVLAGTICDQQWSRTRMSFGLRDLRDGIHRDLPAEMYSADVFPLMDDGLKDKPRSRSWGAITALVANEINASDHVFEVNNGRIKSVVVRHVSTVTTTLTEDTDYFVDYQRGRITLARGFGFVDNDVLEVDFTGGVNLADEAVDNGPEILLDVATTLLPLTLPDFDLNMIYTVKAAKTAALGLCLKDVTNSQDIFRTIEKSISATIVQTNDGRLGFRAVGTAAPGGAPHVSAGRIFELTGELTQNQVYAGISVNYNQNQNDGTWTTYLKTIAKATYESRATKILTIDTALTAAADAEALANEIAGLLEKMQMPVETDRCLHGSLPGDVVYASADRAPTTSGQLAAAQVRLTSLTKSISAGHSSAVVEVL